MSSACRPGQYMRLSFFEKLYEPRRCKRRQTKENRQACDFRFSRLFLAHRKVQRRSVPKLPTGLSKNRDNYKSQVSINWSPQMWQTGESIERKFSVEIGNRFRITSCSVLKSYSNKDRIRQRFLILTWGKLTSGGKFHLPKG